MAKGRKKSAHKSGGLIFKLFVAAFLLALLWGAGRFEIKGRTPYEHADRLMNMRLLQPLYDTLCGGVSDISGDAVQIMEALPQKIDAVQAEKKPAPLIENAPLRDETPLDDITDEDRKALDDLIDRKSRKK